MVWQTGALGPVPDAPPDAMQGEASMPRLKPTEENLREKARVAAHEIRRYIEEGLAAKRLKPGGKLPTERDLAERFSTGRNTVRRTLVDLEAEGKIVRHVGRGTFIAQPPATTQAGILPALDSGWLAQIVRAVSPLDLMELRLSLEPSIAALSVQRASVDEIDRMQRMVEESRRVDDLSAFEDLDDDLHRLIASTTRNPLFASIAGIITAIRAQSEWSVLKQRTLTRDMRMKHALEHEAIVAAIRRRDEGGAHAEMREHLRSVQSMLFERSPP